jgi:hypothetical protein
MKYVEVYKIQIYICVRLRHYQCEHWCCIFAQVLRISGLWKKEHIASRFQHQVSCGS